MRKGLRATLAWALLVCAVVLAGCTERVQSPDQQVAGDALSGRELIETYGCMSCHVVPGVAGGSQVAPPLDGFAHRRVIAGRLPNTPSNLADWIENPQEIDPGNAMPDMGVTPADARDMAAYLYTLR